MNYRDDHKNFTDTLCAWFLMQKLVCYNTYMTAFGGGGVMLIKIKKGNFFEILEKKIK